MWRAKPDWASRLHVVEHSWMLTGAACDRPVVAEHLHPVDQRRRCGRLRRRSAVSVAVFAPAPLSSNCAAPRMPDGLPPARRSPPSSPAGAISPFAAGPRFHVAEGVRRRGHRDRGGDPGRRRRARRHHRASRARVGVGRTGIGCLPAARGDEWAAPTGPSVMVAVATAPASGWKTASGPVRIGP